ncbi:hypothetical protein K502DRAFT_351255 [Neoconidiobolus thromboides FSU 785]|nr:hypothetical protein K502DRAFT_351255 [Neoconidiobolus thromboides FSU 785]
MAIGAFIRGSTNYICHLNVANYTLAAFTYFFRDFVCVSTVLIIIYCYYETSKKVNRFRKVHDIEIKLSISHKKRYRESEVAITKNYISLTAYGLLMFIGNILFSIETILACLNKARFINAIDPLHHVGLIFFGFGFFANTTLILFFHTGIKHEAEEFREQVKKIFKK